jgi:hypothetical protein
MLLWSAESSSGGGRRGDGLKIASPRRGGMIHGNHLPHSRGSLQSAVSQELSDKYAKRKGSDETGKTFV